MSLLIMKIIMHNIKDKNLENSQQITFNDCSEVSLLHIQPN